MKDFVIKCSNCGHEIDYQSGGDNTIKIVHGNYGEIDEIHCKCGNTTEDGE